MKDLINVTWSFLTTSFNIMGIPFQFAYMVYLSFAFYLIKVILSLFRRSDNT